MITSQVSSFTNDVRRYFFTVKSTVAIGLHGREADRELLD
jgi:hypothetical protein